jgi:hypothetical protein
MKDVGPLQNHAVLALLGGAAMLIPFVGWFPIAVVGATIGGTMILAESLKATERNRWHRR